jgi:hypothetical protein
MAAALVAVGWLRGLVVGGLGGGGDVGGEELEFPGAGVDVEVAAEADPLAGEAGGRWGRPGEVYDR